MKLYAVRDREAENVIELVFSKEEAEEVLQKFEEEDKDNDVYEPNFYEIAVADIDEADFRTIEEA